MRFILCLIPICLSFLCIAAHYLRDGPISLAILAILLPVVLFNIQENKSRRTLQLLLIAATAVWIHTLIGIIQQKNLEGASPMISIIIISSVMLLTLFSALLFEFPIFRRRFQDHENEAEPKD